MSTINFSTQNSLSIAQNYLRHIPSTQMQQIAQTPAETTQALQNLVSTGFDQFANVAASAAKSLPGPDLQKFLQGLAGQFAGMTNQGIEQGLRNVTSQPSPTTLENGQQCCPPPMNQRMGQMMQMMMQMMQMMMQMMQQMGMGQGQGGFPGVQGGAGGVGGLPTGAGGATGGLSGGLQGLLNQVGSQGLPGTSGLQGGAASAPLLAPPPAGYAAQAPVMASPYAAQAPVMAAPYAAQAGMLPQAPGAASYGGYAPQTGGMLPQAPGAGYAPAPSGYSGGVSGGTWSGGPTTFTSAASGSSGLSGLLGSAVGSASADIAGTTGAALAAKAGLDYSDPEIKAKMDMMAMQQKLQKTQELLDMMSKFMTAMHDMNKALIGAWRV